MVPSIASALLAMFVSLFRTHLSMYVKFWRFYQVAVYKGSVPCRNASASQIACSGSASCSCCWCWYMPRLVEPRPAIARPPQALPCTHWRRFVDDAAQSGPHCQGSAPTHPGDVAGQPDVGGATDCRRTAEIGHRGGQIHGREVSCATSEAPIANMEGISTDPCQRPGGPRFLHGADRDVPRALRAGTPRA